MTNNLNIDVSKGKLDQKEKGSLLPIECKSIEAQAIGRACRLGQKNKVNVIRVLTKNSIEEDIYKNSYLNKNEKRLNDNNLTIEELESVLDNTTGIELDI